MLLKAWILVCFVLTWIAFYLYGNDKRRAVKRKRRISEAVLLEVGFFGGAAGALLGMLLFRHKTKHWYFWLILLLGLTWQSLLALWLKDLGL